MTKKNLNIFVRCPTWVGDIVMATPVFRCLKENYPDAKICAGIRKYARGILEDSPFIDSFLDCEDKTLAGMLALAVEIKSARFDKAVLLTNSPRAFLSVFIAGVKEKYGYRRNMQRFFLTKGPYPKMEDGKIKALPMTEYYLEICREMGLKISANPKTELFTNPQAEKEIDELLAQNGIQEKDKMLCINPGAKFGSSKCWPPKYFAKFAELAEQELQAKIVLISGPGEEELAQKIISLSKAKITHFGKINLSRLKPFVKRCALMVTNDTGPRHYATALGVAAVVIIGATDPAYTAYGLERTRFANANAKCAPCHRKTCPTDHICMTSVSPEQVLQETKKLWQRETTE